MKRVYEVARDMGLKGRDLASKINGLSLGFTVNNHMTALSESEEEALRRALDREARDNMVEERISATVIRRKPRRQKVVAESVAASSASLLAPLPGSEPEAAPPTPEPEAKPAKPKRRKVAGAAKAEPEETAPVAAEPTAEAAEPVTPEPAEPAPAEPEVVAADAEPSEAAPEPSDEAADAAPDEAETGADSPEAEDGEGEDGASNRPARADIVAAMAKKANETGQTPAASGAQVVGSLSPELLASRLAADRKTFGPAPKQPVATGTRENFEAEQAGRRKRKRGKKVYGANELYDRRSSRRRAQKKPGAGLATQITEAAEHKRVIKMEEAILVSELAHQMGQKAGAIALKMMMELGIKGANINTALDFESATLIADSYGFKVEQVGFDLQKYLPKFEDVEADHASRPPVVTVMGHVDHGKTSLLDAIRATDVASGEDGGITQHIGAYKVELDSGTVVFLDTPGHEAFTALRARGAQATDLVILVVAADDGVMPQTVEAINHAKDAGVPIVVAVNKIDKEGANPERVMQALTEYTLIPEAWGGETLFQEVSAIEGTGVQTLLEQVLLQAEVLELDANPTAPVEAIVIESRLDIGRGPVATVLVQQGTLRPGDIVVAGGHWGRLRALTDERGNQIPEATPSTSVEITGLQGVPEAGETLYAVEDDRAARTISSHVGEQKRQRELARSSAAPTDIEGLKELFEAGQLKELKVIIKSDVQGSQEGLAQALTKLSTNEVKVKIVHAAVGGVTESDVNLAASSTGGAIIIGFNVRPETRATQMAENMGITIRTYNVIYDAVDEVKALMTGLLEPVFEEVSVGRAEVREVFNIPKIGTIAGCYVVDGKVNRGGQARVVRDSRVIYESSVNTLRRFKDDVKEVSHGYECGLSVENFNDIKVGDVIETYELNEVAATLS